MPSDVETVIESLSIDRIFFWHLVNGRYRAPGRNSYETLAFSEKPKKIFGGSIPLCVELRQAIFNIIPIIRHYYINMPRYWIVR